MDENEWYLPENGDTIGKPGLVGGTIIEDAELGDPDDPEAADARVTLEGTAPGFAVTAHLYGGWLQETARFDHVTEAQAAYEAAQDELVRLAALVPEEDDPEMDASVAALNTEVAAFVAGFGGEPTS